MSVGCKGIPIHKSPHQQSSVPSIYLVDQFKITLFSREYAREVCVNTVSKKIRDLQPNTYTFFAHKKKDNSASENIGIIALYSTH